MYDCVLAMVLVAVELALGLVLVFLYLFFPVMLILNVKKCRVSKLGVGVFLFIIFFFLLCASIKLTWLKGRFSSILICASGDMQMNLGLICSKSHNNSIQHVGVRADGWSDGWSCVRICV